MDIIDWIITCNKKEKITYDIFSQNLQFTSTYEHDEDNDYDKITNFFKYGVIKKIIEYIITQESTNEETVKLIKIKLHKNHELVHFVNMKIVEKDKKIIMINMYDNFFSY
jgi:hypothetical protein